MSDYTDSFAAGKGKRNYDGLLRDFISDIIIFVIIIWLVLHLTWKQICFCKTELFSILLPLLFPSSLGAFTLKIIKIIDPTSKPLKIKMYWTWMQIHFGKYKIYTAARLYQCTYRCCPQTDSVKQMSINKLRCMSLPTTHIQVSHKTHITHDSVTSLYMIHSSSNSHKGRLAYMVYEDPITVSTHSVTIHVNTMQCSKTYYTGKVSHRHTATHTNNCTVTAPVTVAHSNMYRYTTNTIIQSISQHIKTLVVWRHNR